VIGGFCGCDYVRKFVGGLFVGLFVGIVCRGYLCGIMPVRGVCAGIFSRDFCGKLCV